MKYKLNDLRKKFPRFIYQSYSVDQQSSNLIFSFRFLIEPGIEFNPTITICGVDPDRVSGLGNEVVNNLAFQLGLAEIPSYWKATCSPEIVIQSAPLDGYQISWWNDLLINGMGEFFYVNDIDFSVEGFLSFKSEAGKRSSIEKHRGKLNPDKILIPVGGGKDSVVTGELLKKTNDKLGILSLNPTSAVKDVIRISSITDSVFVTRVIDGKLLELNREGYFNGHTPFSAYLAFLSSACAVLFDYKQIALSNERSANESNVVFHNMEVNHQYSKSLDFERKFRDYCGKYLSEEVEYFSFLRPLYELQIAKLFSRFSRYFTAFRSCNRGQKMNRWCHECPKCLFVFSALFPFVDTETLTQRIFKSNLFENERLADIALASIGLREAKPFECVGSFEETLIAFYLSIERLRKQQNELPFILKLIQKNAISKEKDLDVRSRNLLASWDDQHFLRREMENLVKREVENGHKN